MSVADHRVCACVFLCVRGQAANVSAKAIDALRDTARDLTKDASKGDIQPGLGAVNTGANLTM